MRPPLSLRIQSTEQLGENSLGIHAAARRTRPNFRRDQARCSARGCRQHRRTCPANPKSSRCSTPQIRTRPFRLRRYRRPQICRSCRSRRCRGSSGDQRQTRPPAPSGFEVPEAIRLEMLSGHRTFGRCRTDRRTAAAEAVCQAPHLAVRLGAAGIWLESFIPWLAAAIAAGVLLIAQVVHQNREWLAAHAPLGGSLRALYSKMGTPVAPPANLSAYQLRQWGVTGDPAGDGTLRVRASILNTAAQLEPYPLLRVTLANRFGGSIGTPRLRAFRIPGQAHRQAARAWRARRCDLGYPGSGKKRGRI